MGLLRSERWDRHLQSQQELFEGGYNDICILSLSLGATRTFEARKQQDSARFSCEFGIQDVSSGYGNDSRLSLHFRQFCSAGTSRDMILRYSRHKLLAFQWDIYVYIYICVCMILYNYICVMSTPD